ncbi:uncharacterized protein [Miscanthus floridulus]|uniref:uncharacterized protein isoform X2 n=1 Tax=Miscanthus floridulus TaxID=154761 RepID=UPI00345B22F1
MQVVHTWGTAYSIAAEAIGGWQVNVSGFCVLMVGELNKLQLQVMKFRPTMGPAKVCMGIEMMPCQEIWDWLALETIQQACDPAASADLAVILMQEGLAHLFLIGRRKLAATVNTKDHTGFVGHCPVTRKFAATLANQPTISHLDGAIPPTRPSVRGDPPRTSHSGGAGPSAASSKNPQWVLGHAVRQHVHSFPVKS